MRIQTSIISVIVECVILILCSVLCLLARTANICPELWLGSWRKCTWKLRSIRRIIRYPCTRFDCVLQIVLFLQPQLLHVLVAGWIDGELAVVCWVRRVHLRYLSRNLRHHAVIRGVGEAARGQNRNPLRLASIAVAEDLVLLGDAGELLVDANLLLLKFLVQYFLSALLDAPIESAAQQRRAEAGARRDDHGHDPVVTFLEAKLGFYLPLYFFYAIFNSL